MSAAQLQSRSAVLSMYKALDKQARAYRETLINRITSHLTHLLTNALGGVVACAGDISALSGQGKFQLFLAVVAAPKLTYGLVPTQPFFRCRKQQQQ